MSDVLCVTNRLLCKEDFLTRIEKIASAHPLGIILREKDLSETEYENLAVKVIEICKKHDTQCILHSFTNVAIKLNHPSIHLPLKILRSLSEKDKQNFTTLGASCHSVEDANLAQSLGCNYITAGHVFETDCKKGLPARGVEFLRKVSNSVRIPVYAIGGITPENASFARNFGASGICVMSSIMTCDDIVGFLGELQ